MKKVICIDASQKKPGDIIYLKEGSEYEVTQSWFWDDCYVVKGFEFDPATGLFDHYIKSRFIPLSSIDETEFVREYKKELV